MKRFSLHEQAALGLRQSINDILCAKGHLESVKSTIDEKIVGMEADIDDIEQQLAALQLQIEQCQQKVYAHWHETQPPRANSCNGLC